MNPSTGLKDVMLRLYEVWSKGDIAFVKRLVSRQDVLLAIGTDPNEWWTDYETFARVRDAQFQEMGGSMKVKAGELMALAEGSMGWVADRPTFQLSDGQTIPLRATAVFHKEEEQWKLVQFHFSLGVPNSDVVGSDLTVN